MPDDQTKSALELAYNEFVAADRAFQQELLKAYGADAGNQRYTCGENPNTPPAVKAAHERYIKCGSVYHLAWQSRPIDDPQISPG